MGPLPRRQALLCCAHVTVKTAPESGAAVMAFPRPQVLKEPHWDQNPSWAISSPFVGPRGMSSLSLSEATTAGQEDVTALSANPSLSLKDAPITIKMTTATKMIMMRVLTI